MLRGALYTGSTGLAMEAGHVSIDPHGRPCPCGSRGCLNVETDAGRFLDAAGQVPGEGSAPLDAAITLLTAGYASDPRVRAAAGTLIGRLGLGLASLVNVVNPDRVLLGGLHKHLLLAAPDELRDAVAARSPWTAAQPSRSARAPSTTPPSSARPNSPGSRSSTTPPSSARPHNTAAAVTTGPHRYAADNRKKRAAQSIGPTIVGHEATTVGELRRITARSAERSAPDMNRTVPITPPPPVNDAIDPKRTLLPTPLTPIGDVDGVADRTHYRSPTPATPIRDACGCRRMPLSGHRPR